MSIGPARPLSIAVIGSGISGLATAWLLSLAHRVTLYEKEDRLGGHSCTVDAQCGPVDMGFIVYNEPCYPNLTGLLRHLSVATRPSDMSFAVSLDDGRLEYAGTSLGTLFARRRNLISPRFWSMIRDLVRFYREAPALLRQPDAEALTLGAYLQAGGYGEAFVQDHLLPMGAAIWSAPAEAMRAYPAAAFVRFCENHGLLRLYGRPAWRTVEGGSRAYVEAMTAQIRGAAHLDAAVASISRESGRVRVRDRHGDTRVFDHVVVAAHADQALALLDDPSDEERRLLGAFRYQRNLAILHTDPSFMPRRRELWSSWNYVSRSDQPETAAVGVTYWMNRLQPFLPRKPDVFLTLNPPHSPREGSVLRSALFEHPMFDCGAIAAQRALWTLQGQRKTWFCGAYFGAGFHEDGLQAGLAVAEALGGVRRPWTVENESGRIHVTPADRRSRAHEAA
jgi:predicted NAD/FAD-binding protein